MVKLVKVCNVCGKTVIESVNTGVSLHNYIGYGSIYDGDHLDLDVCNECFDKFIPLLRKYCKHDPLTEI